jgi:hypothetical protein
MKPTKEPFRIEPELLARVLVQLELDGLVWDGHSGAKHYLAHYVDELSHALSAAGYIGPALEQGSHRFDGLYGQVYWLYNPRRFNAESAKAWVSRQVREHSHAP